MIRKTFRRMRRLAPMGAAAVGLLLLLPFSSAFPTPAQLKGISIAPPDPGMCDPVSITVAGELPPCSWIVGATIRVEQLPCARPTPCPRFVVEITVRQPVPIVCTAIGERYTRSFDVSRLAAGEYTVLARERVVSFSADSNDTTVSESTASAAFTVRPDFACPPGENCYILKFAPARPRPLQDESSCTATAPPGGTACLDLILANGGPVGGLQTTLVISGPDGTPAPNAPIHAVSVEPVGRGAGFQVGWTAEGSKTRLILYSTSGATIAPGSGPLVRICYAIAAEAVPQTFQLSEDETIVADPAGGAVPPCLIFVRQPTWTICVAGPGCDVNDDGYSDVLDIIRLVRCALAGGNDSTPACPDSVAARADCNGDGAVDVRDVICCVRKIVGLQVGSVENRLSPEVVGDENSIGFEGVPRWTSDVEGTATVRIDAASDWGGMQFVLNPLGSPARIRGLSLEAASAREGTQFEWAIDALGIARAMLYEAGTGPRPAHAYRIRVLLEREPSGAGSGTVRIQAARAGTREGIASGIATFNQSVRIDAAAVPAPALLAARPNPSAGETEIGFVLPSDARVRLRIYDVGGRLVRTLIDGTRPAGVHRTRWDGTDERGRTARSGIYFTKLEAGSTIRSERLLLLR